LNDLGDSLTQIHDEYALAHSAVLRKFLGIVAEHLTTQTYIDLGFSGKVESDQTFVHKQETYGIQIGLDVKAWRRSSALARWNVFDWPGALIRRLTGVDASFTPRGSNIPTFLLGIDLVHPLDNDRRRTLGISGNYRRFRLESGSRSLLLQTGENQIYLAMDLRYYRELRAPEQIRSAGLQEFIYFATALTASNGIYVSYSAGRLPLDVAKDQVYSLGLNVSF
jgi:hypothetical protein